MKETIGHFEVTGKIGEGGMGEVYSATDTRLNRSVALKVLPKAFAADSQRMGRFEREAQVLASLSHPNIAAIHGIEESNGTKALVMELVAGEDLSDRIKRDPPSVEESARIGVQIAAALESAHEHGVVHRDLKPANVKVTTDGQVKVLDFGLAKALERPSSGSGAEVTQSPTLSLAATEAGLILGTAAYMSPEQASGLQVDKRSDIWSFGVVLFEMLTGKTLFHGETVSHTMADVLRADVDWKRLPADLPPILRRLLERCLDRKVAHRLRDIGEARIVLEDYLADPEAADLGTLQTTEGAVEQPAAPSRLPWVAAGILALLAAVLATLLWRGMSPMPRESSRFEVRIAETNLFPFQGASVVFSPDGRRIAWNVDDGNIGGLWTRSLDQLAGRQLVRDAALPHSQFFSPDGQWIAFFQRGKLLKVPFTGGTPQTVSEVSGGGRGGAWAPDGTIVFSAGADGRLYKVPAAGGEPTAITDEVTNQASRWPYFLPDGKSIVFITGDAQDATWETARIEIMDLASGVRRQIHSGGYYARITPSGHLTYMSNGSLFAAPIDLDSGELTGDPAPVVEKVGANPGRGSAQYAFSDSGDLVYVQGTDKLPEYPIVRVGADGSETTLWSEVGTYGKPRFSPDGTRLSITRLLDGNWDVWVFDLARSVSTRLTFDDGLDSEQLWSPDGETIIFSSDRDGVDNLYQKRADGSGEIKRLTEAPNAQWACSWSPDGRHVLLMQQEQGHRDLLMLDLESGEVEPYLATEFFDDFGRFSPDGRWVAYASNESGKQEIYVRPFPLRGGKWQISDGGGDQPLWAPDGRSLFYRTNEGVLAARIDGSGNSLVVSRPELVVSGNYRGGIGGVNLGLVTFDDFDVAPDGKSFAFFQGADSTAGRLHATIVLNWFRDLRRLFE